MNLLAELWRRLLHLMQRRSFDRDLEEEMRFHLEMKAKEIGGAAAARRKFGNPALLKEISREMWGWSSLDRLGQDLKYAIRMLGRNPSFTVAAVSVYRKAWCPEHSPAGPNHAHCRLGVPGLGRRWRAIFPQAAQPASIPWRRSAMNEVESQHSKILNSNKIAEKVIFTRHIPRTPIYIQGMSYTVVQTIAFRCPSCTSNENRENEPSPIKDTPLHYE